MHKNISHLLAVLTLISATALVACKPGDDSTNTSSTSGDMNSGAASSDTAGNTASDPANSGMTGGDTSTADNTATGTDTRMGASQAAASTPISITNPMPHDMIVSADWGQGQQELGTVKAGETKSFDIAAASGTSIKLKATDEGKTHSPEGSVTLDPNTPATWTIQ